MLEMTFGKRKISTERPAFVMGIVNATPDSFFENSRGDFDLAMKLIEDGADIIDIGAESTKPYSEPVDDKTQLEKLLPVVKYAKEKNIVTSIDTRSSKVAEECIKLGADIINDVSGFDYDEKIIDVIKYEGGNETLIYKHPKTDFNLPTKAS